MVYMAITLIFAFTIHEFSHAYVAYKFGDSTAKNQGRLTLNPIQHLDPIGTLLIFIAGFGWARPVPVNRFFFKKPRFASICVSLAGPLSNYLLALVAVLLLFVLGKLGLIYNLPMSVINFFDVFIGLNIMLCVFNLIPLPPLDGYRILEDLVPADVRPRLTQLEPYGGLIFLALVITPLDQYTIDPIIDTFVPLLINGLGQILS
ncbi:site-2 protease family protein [Bacillaceae bacterium Marseille-Q3522]|nr:site-2 protease family protein [Bacillaceae bacterium Marseille-Q3522]